MTGIKAKNHTDIKSAGWLHTLLPPRLHPYALLMRLDRPVGWWLLLLPGWWAMALSGGGAAGVSPVLAALFWLGAVIMRGAGCVINDLWDREFDRRVERTKQRPLAAGTVGTRQALAFLASLLLAGFLILLQLKPAAIILGLVAVPAVALYPLMKRWTWWPQAFLGLTFNFGALMGWAAATGTLPPAALLLYGAGIFWTLGYDTIYAHQDRDDDREIGVKSTALRCGPHGRLWVAGFYALAALFFTASFVSAGAGPLSLLLLPLAGLHLCAQVALWNPADAQSSLTMFRANRDFGLLLLLAALL